MAFSMFSLCSKGGEDANHLELVDYGPVDVTSIDVYQASSGVDNSITSTAPLIKEVDQKVLF